MFTGRVQIAVATAVVVIATAVMVLTGLASAHPAHASATGFVVRDGTHLNVDGRPYRFTGVNIYNANSRNNCWYSLGDNDGALDSTLAAVGPRQEAFRAMFFQAEATTGGQRDWAAFDHTLAVARARNVRVIATLVNQWADCEGWGSQAAGYKTESWYQTGYKKLAASPGMPATYKAWVREVVARYKSNTTILAWQLVNEAEANTSYGGGCSSTATSSLARFSADMSRLVKSVDPNHLVSLGTLGTGQCGAAGDGYATVHAPAGIDLCEYHDYTLATMPGDQWNGLQTRINQCNRLGKPVFVGEVGIIPTQVDGTLTGRSRLMDQKISAAVSAGIVGVLAWDWRDGAHGGSSTTGYEIGPNDPVLAVLARH